LEIYSVGNSTIARVITTFSLTNNFEKLVKTETIENFSCIHGIKFVSMVWIILGHTIEWADYNLYSKSFQIKQLIDLNILIC
jgi:hypothetical protein